MQLVAAEYFAGIGLVRMGLEACGWSIAYANDFEIQKYELYRGFFPENDHYEIGNVFNIDAKTIPFTTLATCSFPCIDLSLAGNRNGIIDGRHSSAFWGFINVIRSQGELAPPMVMLENVPGWLTSNNGNDFRITVKALNDLGYFCDVFTLDALRFTPQSRLRVFLVGIKAEVENNLDNLLSRPKALLSTSLKETINDNLDLRWFFHRIPEPPPLRSRGLNDIIEEMAETDPRWWSVEDVTKHLAMMAPSHRERVEKLAQQDYVSYRTFYRRRRNGVQRSEVRKDEIAGCLRTATGGSGRQFLIKAGNAKIKMRTMTAREYARLQGVPDTFPIAVNGVQALTGFGDAVCVPAITWIGENVLNPLVATYFPRERVVIRFYG
ncbi:MAG: DNA cytosine methyltransferase [Bellilinea sp.]